MPRFARVWFAAALVLVGGCTTGHTARLRPPATFSVSLSKLPPIAAGTTGAGTLEVKNPESLTGTARLALGVWDDAGRPVPGIALTPVTADVARSKIPLNFGVAITTPPGTYVARLGATLGDLHAGADFPLVVTPAAKPRITAFAVEPVQLPGAGGTATATWSAIGADSFTLTVTPATRVTGIPTGKVASGPIALGLPENDTGQELDYQVTLTALGVSGATTVSRTVRVAAVPAPTIWQALLDPPNLPAAGGGESLQFNGRHAVVWRLSITAGPGASVSGISVNQAPYTGPVDLGRAMGAAIDYPPNNLSNQPHRYTLALTAIGAPGGVPSSVTELLTTTVAAAGAPVLRPPGSADGWATAAALGAYKRVWVASASEDRVVAYDDAYPLDPKVVATVDTDLASPRALVVDYEGNMWVVCAGDATGPPSITELPVNDPTHPIRYTSPAYHLSNPVDVVKDGSGNLWVTNAGPPGNVLEFKPSDPTNPVVYGAADGIDGPVGVAITYYGDIWVANRTGDSITHIPPPYSTKGPKTIDAATLGIGVPSGIVSRSNGGITVSSTGPNGGISPLSFPYPATGPAVVPASALGLSEVTSIALDGFDGFWVASRPDGVVVQSDPYPNAPVTWPGSLFGEKAPRRLMVDGQGSVWIIGANLVVLNGVGQRFMFPPPQGP